MYYHPLLSPAPAPALLRDSTAAREASAGALPARKWLVPVDGTPASMTAVEYVIAHADRAHTHVHLLNVQPPIMAGDVSVLASAKVAADLRRSAGELAVRDAKRLLSRHAFEHTSEVVFGAPAEAIVRSAAKRGCSRIVIASRRSGVIANLIRRSVSSRVARLSHVPVTVVKPEAMSGRERASVGHAREARRRPAGVSIGPARVSTRSQ
jgi:nucleotide-binding universal stress UspA family protein